MNNINQTTYDLIVVGAGPAGSFTAYLLARAGLKVLMLEKNRKIGRKVCGEYLCPKGVALIENYGLEKRLLSGFSSLHGMDIFTSTGIYVPTNFPHATALFCSEKTNNHPTRGVALERDKFDSALLDLAGHAGADIQMDTVVQSIEKTDQKWIVHTNNGSYQTLGIAGADGRKSRISSMLDNDIEPENRRVALHCYLPTPKGQKRSGEMHLFEDGTYIGIDPLNENETNFSLVTDADTLQKLDGPLATLNHYLQKSVSLKSRYQLITKDIRITAAFPLQHKTKSVAPADCIALIGDAAGFVDPLTGEGLYNAMKSAEIFSRVLLEHLKSGHDLNHTPFALYRREYEKVLRSKSRLNFAFQYLIRHPRLVDAIARFVLKKQKRADAFIGIIGNVYKPAEGIIKLLAA